jgi:NADH:ubiquinone reductase (H+-translocating)
MANQHRVVILGGGFGGLYAAHALKHASADITLIDKRNFHLFQPLLYQVATGSLSPGEIAAPIRSVLNKQKNTNVLLGEAVDIDPAARILTLKDSQQIPYDSLIVATGSQATFFGHNEWRQFSPPLKSVEDATEIRHKILVAFEEAECATSSEERRAWLTFVIVGAGATGVELAGALGEIAHHTLKRDFRSIKPSDATILLVDGTSRALSTFPEDLSLKAQASLEKLGVTMRFGVFVDGMDEDSVTVKDQSGNHERIASKTIIWAAGVAVSDFARQLAKRTGAETDRAGHIKVDHHLTIPNYPQIFVVGDLAYYVDAHGKPLPGVAQVAMQGGDYAAKTIMRRLEGKTDNKPFKYFNKGDLAVIGRAAAIANIFGIHLAGFPAWLVWLFIHLLYIVEFQSRLLVLVHWGFLYLTYDRGARLITGSIATEEFVSRPRASTTLSSEPQQSRNL